ncbi:MAG: DUF1993 domain-containing protein [Pseudomonadota bacterium]
MAGMMSYTVKTAGWQMLPALGKVLAKGKAHAGAIGADEAVLLTSRLYPNMLTLTRNVQNVTDVLVRGSARLADVDLPSFPDTETTFDDLIARLERASQFVEGLDDAAIDASESRKIQLELGPMNVEWEGKFYLTSFIMPNVYFHTTTAYALLRHQGVDIGKRDYLGM